MPDDNAPRTKYFSPASLDLAKSRQSPPSNTQRNFDWKGASVGYRRDGTKSQHINGVNCGVAAPMFSNDGTCSVTVPYMPGIETRVYGVNGYPDTNPITASTTVTRDFDGNPADGWAPQFWLGYTAKPGYFITNPGQGQTHIDFNSPACTDTITLQAASEDIVTVPVKFTQTGHTLTLTPSGSANWGEGLYTSYDETGIHTKRPPDQRHLGQRRRR